MDPARLTLRRLVQMSEARSRQLWDHTAHLEAFLLWMISGKEVDPRKLHPFYRKQSGEPDVKLTGKQGIALFKRMYGRR